MSLNPFKTIEKDMNKLAKKAENSNGEVDKETVKSFASITKAAAVIAVVILIFAIAFPLVTYFVFTHM